MSGFREKVEEWTKPEPPPGIESWEAPKGALSREKVLDLRLGQTLLAYGDLHFDYHDEDRRYGVPYRYEQPSLLYYVGYGYRNEGTYQKGFSGYPFHPSDSEPPSFKTTRRIFVVKVKSAPNSREIDCLPEQVVLHG